MLAYNLRNVVPLPAFLSVSPLYISLQTLFTAFDQSLEDPSQYFEDRKDDGSILKHHRLRHLPPGHVSFDQTENVELLEEEGPPHEAMESEDEEEILDDGTVHKVHKVHRHTLKHIRKVLKSDHGEEDILEDEDIEVAGTGIDTVLETFEEPPKNVTEVEEEDEILPDGTKIHRKVVSSSLVQKFRTRTRSFGEGGEEISSDEYEIEEVVPGTQSCFVARDSSSSSSSSVVEELELLESALKEEQEVLDDGTEIQTTLLHTRESRKTRSRSGSRERREHTYTVEERRVTPAHTPSHSPSHTPRSGSPVQGLDDKTLAALQSVSKKIKHEHFEAKTHKTEEHIETTADLRTDEYLPKLAIKEVPADMPGKM